MFAYELGKVIDVLGIGKEKEIEMIKGKKLYVKRKEKTLELFEGKIIKDFEFSKEPLPDVIFLATRNPVSPVIKYYYQKIKEKKKKLPTLVLSQNGIAAGEDAQKTLKELFGENARKIQIIRVNLFNPVDKKEIENKIYISYSLPIRISFGGISGSEDIQDIADLFKKANFEAKQFSPDEVKNMEFSKLFLNLIGMAAASRGFSVNEGFKDSEIFEEEIESLREYIKVGRASGRNFVNFPHYPVKLLSSLIYHLPISFLLLFRERFGKLISKGRGGKPKDLDEINYYNGAVVSLGKKIKVATPINQKICRRVLKKSTYWLYLNDLIFFLE